MISSAQHKLYLYEWGQLVGAWRSQGLKATDSTRKEITRLSIGSDKSSKFLNNTELDKVIYAFRIASYPRHAAAYRVATDPNTAPILRALHAARHLARQLKDNITDDRAADAYITGTGRQMLKDPTAHLASFNHHLLCNICSAFTYSLRRKEKKLAETQGLNLPATPAPKDERVGDDAPWGNPFDSEPTSPPTEEPVPAYAGPEGDDPF